MLKQTLIIAIPVILLGYGVGGWQSLDGPPAGRADDLTIGWDDINNWWNLFAADKTHRLYRSFNFGTYWDSIDEPNTDHPTCVVTHKDEGRIVFIGRWDPDYIVMKSVDGGDNWEPKDEGITNDRPNCFAMHPENPDIVFLGCGEDNDGSIDEIFKTTNGGTDWSVLTSGLQADNTINDLAITTTPTKGIKLLAATDDGVYYSFDGGANWGLSNLTERSFAVAYGSEFIGYAGTNYGLYRSTDGGTVWQKIGDFTQVKTIGVVSADEVYIAALGNQGRGIYQIRNNDISFLSNLSARRIVVGPEGRVFILSDRGVYAYRSNER